jgi:hypothetical protein
MEEQVQAVTADEMGTPEVGDSDFLSAVGLTDEVEAPETPKEEPKEEKKEEKKRRKAERGSSQGRKGNQASRGKTKNQVAGTGCRN